MVNKIADDSIRTVDSGLGSIGLPTASQPLPQKWYKM